MFGITMRGVGAAYDVALLGSGWHACGRPNTLYIEKHHGDFGAIGKPDQLTHQ